MIRFIFVFFLSIIFGQNIDSYISLLHDGQSEGVAEELPELILKYPNDPGVLYLQALLTADGMKSLELYSDLLGKYPASKYAPNAAVKIGEYLYARGLYSQAGRQLSQIPKLYPSYSDISRVIQLMISSFRAVGENDSISYYINIYSNMFPNLSIENDIVKSKKTDSFLSKPKIFEPEPYVVQIGAFGNENNANRLKLQVEQIGYEVELEPIKVNKKKLHAVRIIRFKSKRLAENAGQQVKKRLGVDFRVLYRPKKGKS